MNTTKRIIGLALALALAGSLAGCGLFGSGGGAAGSGKTYIEIPQQSR
ncbi:hypothetical protein [Acidiphilium sp.]|jgi:hypothetical protein|nr:hypothetical protein [Acidiphilium sp.]MBU6356026.1 hypothetical protein [Rhodospirillales bacterium]MDE2328069.1 hypothetical protein [Rhodospirillales bacterium]